MLRRTLAPVTILIFVSLFLALVRGADAQAPTETPQAMTTSSFMTPPPTVYPPMQADQGAQVYYYSCMTCHGDRGQGLTQEWRDRIGAPDSNCWSSHCHASNRTGSNFSFPKNVPALVGPGILAGFTNAKNLHDFIRARMPYQAPGSLSSDQYWQLTAYLVRANGYSLSTQPLDAARAARLVFTDAAPQPGRVSSPSWLWTAGGAAVILAAAGLFLRLRRRIP